ncbi:two-component system sensor histidine kinase NtrB [Thermovibrio sp.]
MELEDLLFSHPFPLAITDGEGVVIKVNQKFELLLNKSEKYLKGKEISQLLNCPELKEKVKRSFQEEVELLGFRFKDSYIHLSPFFSSSVKRGVLAIIEPAPENPFTENINLFLKGLSHEIRNPLSGIKGAAKLFKELKTYDEELANVIIYEVERIERLLNEITKSYDFTKPSFRCENIHKVIQKAVNTFSHKISQLSVKVNFNFDPSLPEIPIDSDKLIQAMVNVIKNALESMEESKERTLTIQTGYSIRPADFIFIKFLDTGKGMDEEEVKNFFLPFFTTKEEGTGIGTFILKEIIKGHGGEVKVKSKKGRGTEITILLPMKRRNGKNPCS